MTAVPSDATPQDPAHAAEAYASLGWRIVPIAPGKKYPQGLGRWQDAATDNLEAIRNWYTGLYQGHGVGIATGAESGIWVLDVDIADGKTGADSLRSLVADHGDLPPTATAVTGTGGMHIYYAWDPARPPVTNGMATNLPPGLDIRGEGGQVLAAPTRHPNGQTYRWVRDPWTTDIAEAPAWLYELMTVEAPVEVAAAHPSPAVAATSTDDSIAEWFNRTYDLQAMLEAAGWTLHSNHGDDTWWTRPGKNRRDGHSAVLHSASQVLVVFTTEIDPAFATAGVPTADGSGISLNAFYFHAATHYNGDRSACARAARAERNSLEGRQPVEPIDAAALIGQQPAPAAPAAPAVPPTPEPPEPMRLLTVADILQLEPPPPFVGDWLDSGMLFTIPGKYGSLKSFVAMSMCLSVATGQPWLGQPIHRTGPAIYCSLEGAYTLRPRVAGWLEHNDHDDAPGFWAFAQRLNLLDPASIEAFLPIIDEIRPALMIIDTLSKATPGAEENSKPDVSRAYTALDDFRRATDDTNGAVGVVHHTGHTASGRGRGFSGFEDDLDVVLALEGQWKDGPVRLTSQKQKARENPTPIWLSLAASLTGHPVVVPTVNPDPEVEDEGLNALVDQAVELAAAKPGQSKSKVVDAMKAAARWRKLKAIDQAVETGRIRIEYGPKNSQELYPNE